MDSRSWIMIAAIVLYLAGMIVIGIRSSKHNNSTEDFLLGGRSLGPWVTAISAEASDMSSWLLMGVPGLAYATGVADATWTAVGLIIGTYINWRLVAAPLRNYSVKAGNAITVPDFFSNRFREKTPILKVVSAIISLVFFIIYSASGFVACGKLFSTLFGFDYGVMMVLSSAVIVVYTVTGGFLAASLTSLVQGLLMSFSLIVVLVVGFISAGGISAVFSHMSELPGFSSLFSSFDPITNAAGQYSFVTLASGLAWGIGYFGMPHILLRFMAIRDVAEIKKSRRIAMTWVVISLAAAVLIGLVAAALTGVMDMPQRVVDVNGATIINPQTETVFIMMASVMLPAFIAGLALAGVLAATMSTADSQLLVTASSISQNLFKGVIKKDADDKQVMWVSRITVIVVSIVAMIIAMDENSRIFDLVSYAWAGFGASYGAVMLFSLFWKRTTRNGALAGMIGGGATVIIWKNLIKPLGGWFGLYELAPAFVVACALIVCVSLLDKQPSEEIQQEFESIRAMGIGE